LLTRGQQQALEELKAVEDEGGLQIVLVREPASDGDLRIDLVVDCSDVEHAAGGIRLRPRERLRLYIPAAFPIAVPSVVTPHHRWAQTAHVQWARFPCLYRSHSLEWNPADGMFGYLDRLYTWLSRAASGQLDAAGEPIHPPVAYASSGGSIVVHPDAPRARDGPWFGAALLRQRSEHRWDLTDWHPLGADWIEQSRAEQPNGERCAVAATVILPEPIGFEYPRTGAQLLLQLKRQNVSWLTLLGVVGLAARLNALNAASDDPPAPIFVVVGSPGRGVVGEELATHIVAWRIAADVTPLLKSVSAISSRPTDDEARAEAQKIVDSAWQWLVHSELQWTRIYEMRPETTIRRDENADTAYLRGRRVLLLGAGALGGPVAEMCVRAGCASLRVADHSRVHPGILVRQPYFEHEIEEPKAVVLASRLAGVARNVVVTGEFTDATHLVRDPAVLADADLVIDATADRLLRHVIEIGRLNDLATWPPLLTMMIGVEATRGLVAVSRAHSPGAGVDVLRRLGQTSRTSTDLVDVAEDFYPDPARTDLFQPEPGCSDATFRGSAADASGLAGALLAAGLQELANNSRTGPSAAVVRMPSAGGSSRTVHWPADTSIQEASGQFQVRLAAAALAEMRAETRRGARVRGRSVETGGLLLGQYDAASGILWIDAATGPPPDSVLSSGYFEHGTEGVEEIRAVRRTMSARTSDFVGYWHTHPDGAAAPSPTDEHGMGTLVDRVPGCRRALILILGGTVASWDAWLAKGSLPSTYARVVRRGETTTAPVGTAGIGTRSATGAWWPGGFRHGSQPRQRPWWSAILHRARP
jgi:hypothetical protein